MKEPLDLLKNIRKEEPSPFLYTRIIQKVEQGKWDTISKKEAFAIVIPSLCMLIITVLIIIKSSGYQSDLHTIVISMHLKGSYSLY